MNIQQLHNHRSFSLHHYQRGVNLIEIMVAMTIGLFLVLGATTLYVNSKKTSDVDDSIARLQETARYAMSVLEADVRMANYWGQFKDSNKIINKDSQDPTSTYSGTALAAAVGAAGCGANYASHIEMYIEATNNRYTLACNPFGGANMQVTTADTLIVRRAEQAIAPASATRLQVCSNHEDGWIIPYAAADCTDKETHNLIANGYYVDQRSQQSTTYPALRRWTLIDGSIRDDEIIPGVEDMQIELGWDNSNNSTPGDAGAVRYVQPEDAAITAAGEPVGRIVAVRVWLLIRAEAPDRTFTDTRTYEYADRAATNGTVNTLNATASATKAYRPSDNFRRLLVSRTFFVRNVTGT
ncbi:MAG: PilW family protein [Steroidobacteraceae bacterium]